MDLARPYKAVCPTVQGEALQVLFGTTRGLTGREVARLTGRTSHSGVIEALNRLTDHGLVNRVELNKAFLFSLNREHIAYPAVAALAGIRIALLGALRTELEAWHRQPVHASLFGSAARGDGGTASDIDLFVIRPADLSDEDGVWRDQVSELERRTERLTGNTVTVLEKSEPELAALRSTEPPILDRLRAESIHLAGRTLHDLLGEHR